MMMHDTAQVTLNTVHGPRLAVIGACLALATEPARLIAVIVADDDVATTVYDR